MQPAHNAVGSVCAIVDATGTSVSVPLAARGGDGSFYLCHDSLGNPSAVGCAYTTGDASMSDAVTVLYGHSFSAGGLAFTSHVLTRLSGQGSDARRKAGPRDGLRGLSINATG